MLTTGTILQNRYRIVSLLGQGGMGAVYRAWDMRLNVPVALKEMVPQPGLDSQTLAQLRQQFQQEANILARLNHPHLVRVTDFFEEENNAYLVMDFVEGESLADRIARQGALPETEVLSWAGQLLDALGYCHARGVIHRDIKPQNVVIRPDGRAVLVDFGLVKLWDPSDPRTRTVMRGMGTPEYAPPEQYEVDTGHTDSRSDVYGLGATLYHALVGQAPPTATLRMAAPERFVPLRKLNPDVSPATEAAVLRALEIPRSQRWQSAEEMAAGLGIGPPPESGRPPERVTPVTPAPDKTKVLPGAQAVVAARRRTPTWVWVVGGALLLLCLLCGGATWAFRALARRGEAVMTATAQAAQATGTAQSVQTTSTAQALQAALQATTAAKATRTAEAQATAQAHAQETAQAQPPATATLLACVHNTALVPAEWAVLVCDTFDANDREWPDGDYTGDLVTGTKSIVDGVYRWEANALDDVVWWSVPETSSLSDFYLTVQVRRVSGADDAQYGVIFSRADRDNYGLFKIRDSQHFKFSLRHEGEWDTVIDWAETTAVRPGDTNRLTVVAEGSHLTFYVNDQFVGEADEERLSAGKIGLAIELAEAGDSAVFEFDNFEIRAP